MTSRDVLSTLPRRRVLVRWSAGMLVALASLRASAQSEVVPRLTGHPDHVVTEQAVADVRAFAVARAGDRAVVAYVQAGDHGARGSLRTALLRAAADGALDRAATDHTLAPSALAVAITWDGSSGAVVYTIQRPHRGETPGAHRQRAGDRERAAADPLGPSTLTAADVMLQRIDENGAPAGRAVLVFEENARAFRVAVAREGDGWQVAWTGAISVDTEIEGTVRTMRLGPQGATRSFASDTGFTGQPGDVLRVVPSHGTRTDPWVLFTGDRCATHATEPPFAQPTEDPSAAIEPRPRTLLPQQPPHERPGPPVVCEPRRVFVAALHADGTTGPLGAGPALAADAFGVFDPGDPLTVVAPLARGLAAFELDARGQTAGERAVGDAGLGPPAHDLPTPPTSAEQTTPLALSPARVAPPTPPDIDAVLRAPLVLDVARADARLTVFALSPSRARAAFGSFPVGGDPGVRVFTAPGPRTFDIAVAGDGVHAPWLFAQTGTVQGGPLVYLDGDVAALHATAPETPWAGDERFAQHLLRARAARAAYTAAEGVFGPLSERPDAATNPRLPGIAAGMRRLRGPWDTACEALRERARFLVRHGVDADITQLASEQCELPIEPVLPGTPGAPVQAPAP
ncbi:MAG: hypothetical protein WCJ30_07770 [Deltaproteobacteria bacterium]